MKKLMSQMDVLLAISPMDTAKWCDGGNMYCQGHPTPNTKRGKFKRTSRNNKNKRG